MAAKTHRYGVPRRVAEDNRGATGPFILGGASHATIGTVNIHSPNRDVQAHPQPSPQPPNPSVAVSVTVQCEHLTAETDRKEKNGDAKRVKEVPRPFALLGQLRFSFPSLAFLLPAEKRQGLPAPEGSKESTKGKDLQVTALDKTDESSPAHCEVYVQTMLGGKNGLPLWSPGSTNPKIHPHGVVPGYPGPLRDVEDMSLKDAMQRPERRIQHPATLATKWSYYYSGFGILYEFCCSEQSGAILAMPTPVDKDVVDNRVEFEQYICDHADAIFRRANTIRRIREGESLYIVTSCIKSGSWALAAYKKEMADRDDTFRLVSTSSAPNHDEDGHPNCEWRKQPGSGETRWGRSADGHMKDQTLFLDGFKLAVSKEFRSRMEDEGEQDGVEDEEDEDENENDESNSQGFRDAQPDCNTNHPGEDPNSDGKDREPSSKDSQGSSQGSGQNSCIHHQACTLAEAGIDCIALPGTTFASYHPSDVINSHILSQTGCDISICHDDTWCQLLEAHGTLNTLVMEIFPMQTHGLENRAIDKTHDGIGSDTLSSPPLRQPAGTTTGGYTISASAVLPTTATDIAVGDLAFTEVNDLDGKELPGVDKVTNQDSHMRDESRQQDDAAPTSTEGSDLAHLAPFAMPSSFPLGANMFSDCSAVVDSIGDGYTDFHAQIQEVETDQEFDNQSGAVAVANGRERLSGTYHDAGRQLATNTRKSQLLQDGGQNGPALSNIEEERSRVSRSQTYRTMTTCHEKSASVLRQLCHPPNRVKALRRNRASTPHPLNGIEALWHRRGLQNSIDLLNIAFSIAFTIPVVGPPLKGALEALCKILVQVERRFQNAEASARLIQRLAALGMKFPIFGNRDRTLSELTQRLHAIRDELESLMHKPGAQYIAIAQALAGFTSKIDSCLLDYIVSYNQYLADRKAIGQIQLQTRVRVTDAERLATQCIQVIDPFGHPQLIPCVDAQNPNVVAAAILNRYTRDPGSHQAFAEFAARGMYGLTIDDGNQIYPLTADSMSTLSHGGTVVMNVVIMQIIEDQEGLQCPICKGPMPVSQGDDQEGWCTACDRRIESNKPSANARKHMQGIDSLESCFRHITIGYTSAVRVQDQELLLSNGDAKTAFQSCTTSRFEELPEADEDAAHSRGGETYNRDISATGSTQSRKTGNKKQEAPMGRPEPGSHLGSEHPLKDATKHALAEGHSGGEDESALQVVNIGSGRPAALGPTKDDVRIVHNEIQDSVFELVSKAEPAHAPLFEYSPLVVKGDGCVLGTLFTIDLVQPLFHYLYLNDPVYAPMVTHMNIAAAAPRTRAVELTDSWDEHYDTIRGRVKGIEQAEATADSINEGEWVCAYPKSI